MVVRVLPSRKLKTVVPIPWAEPAVVVAQPLTAFIRPKQFKNEGLKRKLVPELKLVPTVVIVPEQPVTAFTPVKQLNNPGLKRHLRLVSELDRYAPFVVPEQPPTAYLAPTSFIRPSKRRFLVLPEINVYPKTADIGLPVTTVSARFSANILGTLLLETGDALLQESGGEILLDLEIPTDLIVTAIFSTTTTVTAVFQPSSTVNCRFK